MNDCDVALEELGACSMNARHYWCHLRKAKADMEGIWAKGNNKKEDKGGAGPASSHPQLPRVPVLCLDAGSLLVSTTEEGREVWGKRKVSELTEVPG